MNKEISLVYSIGLSFAVLFALGFWLDQKLHTGYVCSLIGGLLGIAYMIWEIYKIVKDSDQNNVKH